MIRLKLYFAIRKASELVIKKPPIPVILASVWVKTLAICAFRAIIINQTKRVMEASKGRLSFLTFPRESAVGAS